jgi:stearoyl-CoA desaturase (delta-9 desaturase)
MQHSPSEVASRPMTEVTLLGSEQVRLQRILILILTVVPFVGTVVAIGLLWGRGIGQTDLLILVLSYLLSGLGITVGFHRLFAHRSFEARGPLRLALAVAGTTALEGSLVSWVAAHRRHHAYSDRVGDPHSPHLEEEEGVRGILKGLWHAHAGWLFDAEKSSRGRWAPDLLKDPALVRIDRHWPMIGAVSLVVVAAAGFVAQGTWRGALTALLWGGPVRIFLVHHVTWSVNSICHFYGAQPFRTNDHSANNWLLALPSLGESWHNNHHAFPTSARHGLGPGQIDVSAAVISALERVRFARRVKRPSGEQLMSRRRL